MKCLYTYSCIGALLAACAAGEDAPASLITEPRVLAIQAEPPVLAADSEAVLSALLVDAGGRDVDIELAWRACNPWQVIADPTADCGPEQSLALASSPAGARLNMADVLRAFPPPPWYEPGEPAPADSDCALTYSYLDLSVVVEGSVAGDRLMALKRVRVTPQPIARRNPVITEFTLDDELTPAVFEPGATLALVAAPRQDSLDEVCTAGAQTALEPVRIHIYTDAGELGDAYIDVEYSAEGQERAGSTTWTAPADSDDAALWLVAIDGEGGVGWQRFALSAAAPVR